MRGTFGILGDPLPSVGAKRSKLGKPRAKKISNKAKIETYKVVICDTVQLPQKKKAESNF